VAAGDGERRKLERNLHDGAQQHLVALAVKLRLARDAVEDDPEDAMAMIDEIKGDVHDAIAELRCPGPRDLPAAARVGRVQRRAARGSRASVATDVQWTSSTIGRYSTTSRRPCTSAWSRPSRTPTSTPATDATAA
jgi:hypothetical protein